MVNSEEPRTNDQEPMTRNQEPMTMNKYLILIALILAVFSANAKTVIFSVDMTGQTVSPNGVHVSGDFQEEAGFEGGDWQSNTTVMTNEPGTEIYSVIVDIPAFAKYEYKFINGDQWYEVEFVPLESRVGYDFNDNRWVYIDSLYNDTTLIAPVMFSGNAPAGHYLLRLKVDMSLEESIDPAGIHAALDFQNMDPELIILFSFGEDVYEQIVYVETLPGNTGLSYTFVNGNTEAGYEIVPAECAFDFYRYIGIIKDTVVETVCFSECVSCEEVGTVEFTLPSNPRLYPNPCKERAFLEFKDQEKNHNVSLIDILGKPVRYFINHPDQTLVITRDNLPPGIYYIRTDTENRRLNTIKLIITD
jgi:hypothetical protein